MANSPMTGWWFLDPGEDGKWELYGVIDDPNREDPEKVVIAELTLNPHPSYDVASNARIIRESKAMYDILKSTLAARDSWSLTPEGCDPIEINWPMLEMVVRHVEEG